ncbi:hypothetical protein [Streptomyces sp. WAC08241]|uniref:hypothetical protein n=1 Tax=Streptomyces sp. WAC08241 TaxID=2487421 RepID=UPI000F775E73|nr:hypothetical protein [Streptomyces sp. WAC08241]RSS31987.1 hypothetical protein EF906_34730 [Streptomyces sp. WAC08241]
MDDSDEEGTAAPGAVVRRDAPGFARGPGEGRPREYRRGRAWSAMALARAAVPLSGTPAGAP